MYIIGRTLEKLQTVAETYGKNVAGQIIPLQGDISKKDDIARMYEEIKSKEKCVCILINNAGISSNTVQTEASSADEMRKNCFEDEKNSFDDWVDTYRTNGEDHFFTRFTNRCADIYSTAMLLHDDVLPSASGSLDQAPARLLWLRHQYLLHLRHCQDGSAPFRIQRLESGSDPSD